MTKNMKKAVLICGASVLILWTVSGCQEKKQPTAAVASPPLQLSASDEPKHLAELDGQSSHDESPAAEKPCKSKELDGAEFYKPGETTTTHKFLKSQAASGARADSTFNAIHFDGGKLNSLGVAKVDAMLADDDTVEPVVFYLNMAEGDAFKSDRQDAIVACCKTRGMTETQISFKLGPNPATYSPSQDILSRMNKTESGGAAGGGEMAPSITPEK